MAVGGAVAWPEVSLSLAAEGAETVGSGQGRDGAVSRASRPSAADAAAITKAANRPSARSSCSRMVASISSNALQAALSMSGMVRAELSRARAHAIRCIWLAFRQPENAARVTGSEPAAIWPEQICGRLARHPQPVRPWWRRLADSTAVGSMAAWRPCSGLGGTWRWSCCTVGCARSLQALRVLGEPGGGVGVHVDVPAGGGVGDHALDERPGYAPGLLDLAGADDDRGKLAFVGQPYHGRPAHPQEFRSLSHVEQLVVISVIGCTIGRLSRGGQDPGQRASQRIEHAR